MNLVVHEGAGAVIGENCSRCGQCNAVSSVAFNRVQGFGSEHPEILVVLPGIDEKDVQAQTLFSDSLARIALLGALNHHAPRADGSPWDAHVMFTSAIKCFVKGKLRSGVKDYCADYLVSEIGFHKPKIVIGLGGTKASNIYSSLGLPPRPLGYVEQLPQTMPLFGTPDGTKYWYDLGCRPWVFQVTDPRLCFDEPENAEDFHHHLSKVAKILAGEYPKGSRIKERAYHTAPTADFAVQVLDYFASQPVFSFDIETGPGGSGRDPYDKRSKVLCIGFSDTNRNSYCIPLEHKDNPIPVVDRPRVLEALKRCLESPARKVAQNGVTFDCLWFPVKYNIQVNNFWFDTQLAHALLNENTSHRLKRLAEMYTDLEYYDDELQDHFGSIPSTKQCYEQHVPFDVLTRYCAADCDATMQLAILFENQLKAAGLWQYFQTLTMRDARSVLVTQLEGLKIDDDHRRRIQVEFEAEIVKAQGVMDNSPAALVWKQDHAREAQQNGKCYWHSSGWVYPSFHAFSTAPNSPLCWADPATRKLHMESLSAPAEQWLDGLKLLGGTKPKPGPAYSDKPAKPRSRTLLKSKVVTDSDITLNPGSTKQLREFMFGSRYLKLHTSKTTSTGEASTDREVLQSLLHVPEIKALYDLRSWRKALGSYCLSYGQGPYEYQTDDGKTKKGKGHVCDDGLCHPKFMLAGNDTAWGDIGGGTVTGRKSAKDPPIQTIKTRGDGGKQIKRMFITKHQGGAWYMIDFSQLELRLFAMIAGISWMIDQYLAGADLHLELAQELFKKSAEDCLANGGEYRAYAKQFWFGPIYGEGAKGIHQQLTKQGLHLSEQEVADLLSRMYNRMPEFGKFKAMVEASLNEYNSVWSVTGRRRYLPRWRSRDNFHKAKAGRQAINFLIQSVGSDMTTVAWFLINEWAAKVGLRARVHVSVHDSTGLDCPPGELPLVAVAAQYIMEHIPLKFLQGQRVPILADGEAGINWGDQFKLDKAITADPADVQKIVSKLPDDLKGYVNCGVSPLAHWQTELANDWRIVAAREMCAEVLL